jgi:hypothetical protein
MATHQATVGAPQSFQNTDAAPTPSLAGQKRKAADEKPTEQDVQDIVPHPQSSQTTDTKRAKLSHQDNDTPSPTAKPATRITKQSKKQAAPGAAQPRKKQFTPSAAEKEKNQDVGDQPEAAPEVEMVDAPPAEVSKPRKKATASADGHNTDAATTQVPEKSQRSKKRKTLPSGTALPAPDIAGVTLGDFFTKPLPAKVTPWNLDCPQAYGRYDQETDSPINWGADAFSKLELIDQRVYDLRAPWNPKHRTDDEVVKLYEEITGKKYSNQGLRKRFEETNRTIFVATGVYFQSIGLQKYGIPTDADMKGKMKQTGSGQYAGTTYKPAKKSEKKQAAKKDSVDKVDEFDKVKETKGVKVPEAAEFILETTPEFGCISGLISIEVMETLCIDFSKDMYSADVNFDYCTEATFDRWYSCVCFGHRYTLPKRVYKLKELSGKHEYVDEGVPPVTIQNLLDTYCFSQLMGTTAVSDMILDEIRQALVNEEAIVAKYAQGSICEGDCNDVVRFLDLAPQDIEKLWLATRIDDPIRKLIVSLFTHGMTADECDRVSKDALDSERKIRNLYIDFKRRDCQKTIVAFIDAASSDIFCGAYHNHGVDGQCHRDIPLSPLSKQMIDDTLDYPIVHKLTIKNVDGCSVINKTGSSLNMDWLQRQKPHWDWERVHSINSWIVTNPNSPQTREPHPVYFDKGITDISGRYPSHPGYEDLAWEPYVAANEYGKGDWDKAKRFDLPPEAQRVRDDTTGEVLFDLEDEEWFPPLTFQPEITQRPDQSWLEYHSFRRLLWVREGNKIPMTTCRRWRPFNGPPILREDTFKDAAPHRR